MLHEVDSPWLLESHQVVDLVEGNLTTGLTDVQASHRRSLHGKNELPVAEDTPFLKLVAKQFEDLLVIILLLAAVVSFILALFEEAGEDRITAFVEPVVILLILIANATVGVVQEQNAENAIKELKEYEASTALVLRNGEEVSIPASDLVPGDIITVKVGDKIPADCRLVAIHSSVLTVDQSILTGESGSVMKNTSKVDPTLLGSRDRTQFQARAVENVGIKPPSPTPNKPVKFSKDLTVNQDKTNMLFSGTLITAGRAVAVVTSTGITTAIGKINSAMLEQEEEKTPLKIQLDQFGEQLSKLIGVVCLAVWLINIGHFSDPVHGSFLKGAIYYFKIAVALAVAAVPEGLPAVVTTCLALGTRSMAKEGAIVRSLPSVETLGCTTVICVDKTGTLTTNQMAVQKIILATEDRNSDSGRGISLLRFNVEGSDYTPCGKVTEVGEMGKIVEHPTASHPALVDMARVCALCNDAKLEYDPMNRRFTRIGEPTEAALRVLVEKLGLLDDGGGLSERASVLAEIEKGAGASTVNIAARSCSTFWEAEYRRDAVLEFTRSRKSMGVICTNQAHGTRALFVKGAPESVLERCTSVRLDSGGTAPIDEAFRKKFKLEILKMGAKAYRLMAIAQGEAPSSQQTALDIKNSEHFSNIEQRMTLIGLVGMIDPVRNDAKIAVSQCQNAGIRVIVLTGDNQATANSVCKKLGILDDCDVQDAPLLQSEDSTKSITGRTWNAMSDSEKREVARHVTVLSRVEPIHKLEMVQFLRDAGEVVAMTGDGVNDAPALKKADIGIAMGSGTAVAKEASDLVLLTDKFSTIVLAVKQGRSIFANTKQFIRYLISSNIGEVACIFFTAALGIPEALNPVQLLWVNFVTDGLPATALSFNKPDSDVMRRAPRSRKSGFVDNWMAFRYAIVGLYVGVAVVEGFVWWYLYYEDGPQISWSDLASFETCQEEEANSKGYSCAIFRAGPNGKLCYPSTIALSILVMIEMLNALNSLSENESLIDVPPWSNFWLIGAITLSFLFHFMILYIPRLASIFGVVPISGKEWLAVFWFSAPVILIDEVVKFLSRRVKSRARFSYNTLDDGYEMRSGRSTPSMMDRLNSATLKQV